MRHARVAIIIGTAICIAVGAAMVAITMGAGHIGPGISAAIDPGRAVIAATAALIVMLTVYLARSIGQRG